MWTWLLAEVRGTPSPLFPTNGPVTKKQASDSMRASVCARHLEAFFVLKKVRSGLGLICTVHDPTAVGRLELR